MTHINFLISWEIFCKTCQLQRINSRLYFLTFVNFDLSNFLKLMNIISYLLFPWNPSNFLILTNPINVRVVARSDLLVEGYDLGRIGINRNLQLYQPSQFDEIWGSENPLMKRHGIDKGEDSLKFTDNIMNFLLIGRFVVNLVSHFWLPNKRIYNKTVLPSWLFH